MRVVRAGLDAVDRRGDDDRSAALLHHVRQHGLRRLPDPREVDGDHVIPLLIGELVGGGEREDAGVGDQDVDAAETRDALRHRSIQIGLLAHVTDDGDDAPVEIFDLPHGLVEVGLLRHRVGDRLDLVEGVDDDDVGAFLGARDGVGATLAARAARDEGDFSVEHSHEMSFRVRLRATPAGERAWVRRVCEALSVLGSSVVSGAAAPSGRCRRRNPRRSSSVKTRRAGSRRRRAPGVRPVVGR